MNKKYYAVYIGREPGVYSKWSECEKQIKGFSGSIFQSFNTYEEALEWLGW